MERKSIGSFISALRKSNGMTQKMLAEMLNISDKAVSRWERDECAPDLSLIPAIAEIFGVTADELLCGERKNPNATAANPNARTEKQKQRLLNSAFSKFRMQSLISLGISASAIIVAVIMELLFARYPITLLFTAIIVITSVISEVTFLHNLFTAIGTEEFDGIKTDALKVRAIDFSKKLFSVNYWIMFVFTALQFFLPFCTGYDNEEIFLNLAYLFSGTSNTIFSPDVILIALIYIAAGYIVFKAIWYFTLKRLSKTDAYPVNTVIQQFIFFKKRVFTVFSLVLLFTIFTQLSIYTLSFSNGIFYMDFVKPIEFNDLESFKEYAESPSDEITDTIIAGLRLSVVTSGYDNSAESVNENVNYYDEITDNNGKVLCRYKPNNSDIYSVNFRNDDSVFPITVRTISGTAENEVIYRTICVAIILFELLAMAVVYLILSKSKSRKLGIKKT